MAPHPSSPDLVTTRRSLHRVAEHVLSAARARATGRIGLRPGPGGFRTPPFGADDRVLAVDGTDILVLVAGQERRTRLTTVREAAAFAGTEPGFPEVTNPAATALELDAPLQVDPAAAGLLAGWFALGAQALAAFAAQVPKDGPSEAQLWPEHFDLGVSAAGVNYGASPGDDAITEPYVYVGPHEGPPPDDFFSAPFGAYRTMSEVSSAEQAVAFFPSGA